MMTALFRVHPDDVLDELFNGDEKSQRSSVHLLDDATHLGERRFEGLSDEVLLGWCSRDPKTRYALTAAFAEIYKPGASAGTYEWTTLGEQLLMRAPDPAGVLTEMVKRIHPTSWDGSLAAELESRLRLLDRLEIKGEPVLTNALKDVKAQLKRRVETERRRETAEDRGRSERFE
jgi:hypothetical protein